MATTAPATGDRQITIGRVFERAFTAIKTSPGVILGLALLIGALPGLLMTYLFVQLGVGSAEALAAGGMSLRAIIAASLVSVIISMVISALVQGALTRAAVTASEGRKASFSESLQTGLRVILPLIALSILFSIAITFGFLLLIVPGFILLTMWAVAVPALVIERTGVFGAFSRSSDLTKGARWKILGIFLILVVIYWLLSVVVGIVGLSAYSPSAPELTVANILGSVVAGTIFNAVWGTVQPALYVELRQWKEGTSVEALEEVFA